MNAVGEILELGQRLAWATLRVLAGLVGLAVGAVAGRPGRRRRAMPDLPAVDAGDRGDADAGVADGLRNAASLMQQMQDQRDAWPEPPPVTRSPRPMTYDAYREGRR